MKTPEEIIKERYPFYDSNLQTKDVELDGERIMFLMEEYASQYKTKLDEAVKVLKLARIVLVHKGMGESAELIKELLESIETKPTGEPEMPSHKLQG